jgi:hypothetical protein
MATRRLEVLMALLAALGGGASCLPADTRPPPGSILLMVASADEPEVTTADGWSITVDRLLLGMGQADLANNECEDYTEGSYLRLLDGRRATEQKVNLVFGLGQCDFSLRVVPPTSESLLGEGVSEADKELMKRPDGPLRNPGPGQGIAVDFAATATRGAETKHVHWRINQPTSFQCSRGAGTPSLPFELRSSDDHFTLHIALRGAALFGDDDTAASATLRFDPFAAADTVFGNADGDVTINELAGVSLNVARQFGPYGVEHIRGAPSSLEAYLYLALLPQMVGFREEIACESAISYGYRR